MIFIIRAAPGETPQFDVKMERHTPAIVSDSDGRIDYFCLGDPDAAVASGLPVVRVHDGWYADGNGGGMAIWGQGMFWEVRDTPFTVSQACGKEAWGLDQKSSQDAEVNVRQAIFQG